MTGTYVSQRGLVITGWPAFAGHDTEHVVRPRERLRHPSRHRNILHLLGHVVALLYRRAVGDGDIPALHVGILGEVDGLPLVARDPWPGRDIGDRIVVRQIFMVLEPAVEHPIEPVR